jgi:hypothetical protein
MGGGERMLRPDGTRLITSGVIDRELICLVRLLSEFCRLCCRRRDIARNKSPHAAKAAKLPPIDAPTIVFVCFLLIGVPVSTPSDDADGDGSALVAKGAMDAEVCVEFGSLSGKEELSGIAVGGDGISNVLVLDDSGRDVVFAPDIGVVVVVGTETIFDEVVAIVTSVVVGDGVVVVKGNPGIIVL